MRLLGVQEVESSNLSGPIFLVFKIDSTTLLSVDFPLRTMYKPEPQDLNSTNQPPVAPLPNQSFPPGTIKVLAPEGHFPPWLIEELKALGNIGVTTFQTTFQAKERILNQSFDLYLIPDRPLIEGISHQKFQPLPLNLFEPKEYPLPLYLNHPLDPHNQFSVPYGCTYYGFAYHQDAFPKGIRKWKELFHSDDFAQIDFPEDPELLYTLTLIADEQVGKVDKKLDFKTPTNPQGEEFPIRVRTLSELEKLASQNSHWKVVRPEEGSPIELYSIAIGTLLPTMSDLIKKILNPLVAARISEENFFPSTFKATQLVQNPIVRKKLYPESKWVDKAIFIRPPRAAKAAPSV